MKAILLIEDDREISGNIKFVLEKEYRVFTAFAGRNGLDILKKEKISLVILDYMLPDINGLEVLKNIKECYKIPVIMITAHGDKEVVLKSWRYQADWYFDKPFSLKALREKTYELFKAQEGMFPFDALGLDPNRLSPPVVKALEFIGSNLSNRKSKQQKMTLQVISETASITSNHLCSLFRKECGRGIFNIITILKMEEAKKLLHNRVKNIKEISHELGYSHPNNFSRVFKKITGKSPSVIRKEII
jgi:YesN/AraC family two-component response regulator